MICRLLETLVRHAKDDVSNWKFMNWNISNVDTLPYAAFFLGYAERAAWRSWGDN
jgi:hypothetical protein